MLEQYITLLLGSFLGAVLSILGGFINTKHTSNEVLKEIMSVTIIK